MPRAYRKNITLRLGPYLTCNVDVYSSVSSDATSTGLNMVCCGDRTQAHPPVKITQQYSCPSCNHVAPGDKGVADGTWRKGRDNGDGTFTIPTQEDLAALQAVDDISKGTMMLTLHPADEVEGKTVHVEKPYLLSLDTKKGALFAPIYGLLRDIVRDPNVAVLTTWGGTGSVKTYRLIPQGDLIAMAPQADPESLNERPTLPEIPALSPAELAQAELLTKSLVEPYDPANYRNVRREALEAHIASLQAVAAGEAPAAAPVTPVAPGGLDLSAMLQKSLDALQPAAKTPAKRTPAARKPRAAKPKAKAS